MIRENPALLKGEKSTALVPRYVTEARVFSHTLSLLRVLMEVAGKQLEGLSRPEGTEVDLAVLAQHRINLVLRRILPALRIASKWVRANQPYLSEGLQGIKAGHPENSQSPLPPKYQDIDDDSLGINLFWSAYASLCTSLSNAFALNQLPLMHYPLNEDIHVRGFLPLASCLFETDSDLKEDQEHPNILNLMRISDFVTDVELLRGIIVRMSIVATAFY